MGFLEGATMGVQLGPVLLIWALADAAACLCGAGVSAQIQIMERHKPTAITHSNTQAWSQKTP